MKYSSVRFLRYVSYLFLLMVLLMGWVVDYGWFVKSVAITQINPSFAPMQFNTALCFWVMALGCLLYFRFPKLGLCIAVVSGVFAFVTLCQYLFGVNFHIDNLFVKPFTVTKTSHAGRMAPNTALAFVVSAAVLCLLYFSRYRRLYFYTGTVLVAVLWILAVLAMFGYLTGLESTYGWGQYTRMAIHTTIGFLCLGFVFCLEYFLFAVKEQYDLYQFFSIIVALSALNVSWVVSLGVTHAEEKQVVKSIQVESSVIAAALKNSLQEHIHAMGRMTNRWGNGAYPTEDSWKKDAINHFLDLPGIDLMAVVRNKQHIIVSRSKEYESLFNEYTYRSWKKYKSITFVPLVNNSSNSRIFLVRPIESHNQNKGDMIALLNLKVISSGVISKFSLDLLDVKILKENTVIYQNKHESPTKDQLNASSTFLLGNLDFQVDVSPTVALQEAVRTSLGWIVLCSGLIVALFLYWILFILNRFQHMKTSLESKNQELNQFAYTASHDLKSPLRAISALVGFIKEDAKDNLDEITMKHFIEIQNRVLRMERLLTGILNYAKVGREEIEATNVSVRGVLEEILKTINVPENAAVNISSNMPLLKTPKILLMQVFSNLISNAVKYGNKEHLVIDINSRISGASFIFSVSDNGKGIEKINQEKVFDIFETLQSKQQYENTGIGLAIVKKIIDGNGGRIWLESGIDEGTTFYFTWPREWMHQLQ